MSHTIPLRLFHITFVTNTQLEWSRPLLLDDCGQAEVGLCLGRLQVFLTAGRVPLA